MSYRCLQNQSYSLGDYTIVAIRWEDMYHIMEWRNEQIFHLRQKEPLTRQMQEMYYKGVLVPSFVEENPAQVLVSFLYKGTCVGYGGIVHIDWVSKRGEVSFLVETKRTADPHLYRQDFTHYLQLIKKVAFGDLGLHRLYGETYDLRPLHIEILESQGFEREGRLKEHVFVDGHYVDAIIHGCFG